LIALFSLGKPDTAEAQLSVELSGNGTRSDYRMWGYAYGLGYTFDLSKENEQRLTLRGGLVDMKSLPEPYGREEQRRSLYLELVPKWVLWPSRNWAVTANIGLLQPLYVAHNLSLDQTGSLGPVPTIWGGVERVIHTESGRVVTIFSKAAFTFGDPDIFKDSNDKHPIGGILELGASYGLTREQP